MKTVKTVLLFALTFVLAFSLVRCSDSGEGSKVVEIPGEMIEEAKTLTEQICLYTNTFSDINLEPYKAPENILSDDIEKNGHTWLELTFSCSFVENDHDNYPYFQSVNENTVYYDYLYGICFDESETEDFLWQVLGIKLDGRKLPAEHYNEEDKSYFKPTEVDTKVYYMPKDITVRTDNDMIYISADLYGDKDNFGDFELKIKSVEMTYKYIKEDDKSFVRLVDYKTV